MKLSSLFSFGLLAWSTVAVPTPTEDEKRANIVKRATITDLPTTVRVPYFVE